MQISCWHFFKWHYVWVFLRAASLILSSRMRWGAGTFERFLQVCVKKCFSFWCFFMFQAPYLSSLIASATVNSKIKVNWCAFVWLMWFPAVDWWSLQFVRFPAVLFGQRIAHVTRYEKQDSIWQVRIPVAWVGSRIWSRSLLNHLPAPMPLWVHGNCSAWSWYIGGWASVQDEKHL